MAWAGIFVVVVAVAWLVAMPIVASIGYRRTRSRWPRAKRIWLLYGAGFAGWATACLCMGVEELVPPTAIQVRDMLPLMGLAFIAGGALLVAWASYYQGLDKMLTD